MKYGASVAPHIKRFVESVWKDARVMNTRAEAASGVGLAG